MNPQAFTIHENDEVDLVALRRCFADSKLSVRKRVMFREFGGPEHEAYLAKHAHEMLTRAASAECVRFDGKEDNEKGQTRTYAWSLYSIHPDTAEDMIRAIDFLIDRFGPRFKAPTRAVKHAPQIKRNAKGDDQ